MCVRVCVCVREKEKMSQRVFFKETGGVDVRDRECDCERDT